MNAQLEQPRPRAVMRHLEAGGTRHKTSPRRRVPWIAIAIILIMILGAIWARIAPLHNPVEISLIDRHRPPVFIKGGSWTFPLGTDSYGRDILSRVFRGAEVSLIVAAVTILLSSTVGTAIGMYAGVRGGWIDSLLMRLVDVFLAMPVILIALVFAATLGPSVVTTVIVMAVILWSQYARVIRAETRGLTSKDFVLAARVCGTGTGRIITRHVLPNVLNTVFVLSTLQVGFVIILEATLSFLGAGVPPPAPTWGAMISEGRGVLAVSWWVAMMPGIALALVVLSFNNLGDWLRDALDPTIRNA